jgi:hypothetical protein
MDKKRNNIPSQDHGISNIRTLKFIKAEHTRPFRNVRHHKRDRIEIVSVSHLHHMQSFVNILHEIVKMYPRLRGDVRGKRIVKEIHQHRLPTSNIAMHIEALGNIARDPCGGVDTMIAMEQGSEKGGLCNPIQ